MKTYGSLVAAIAALVLAVLGSMACGGGSETPDPPDARPRVDALPVVCGDGIKVASEQCDDGNTMDGDGCSAMCLNETEAFCGNGVRESGEECDDGNLIAGDGCSAVCAIEMTGPRCGNGVREGSETCDDGNTTGGDGCSAACMLETGTCGNGVLNMGEQCDDGNTIAGDGCSPTCRLEGAVCGNGTVEAGEQCDDGNMTAGDGCSPTCRTETPMATCGNGVRDPGEGCDDGNTVAGDGCSPMCQPETVMGTCSPDLELVCDSIDSWNTTYAGATDAVDRYACVSWEETGPEYTYTFVATSVSAVTVALYGTSADLDLFVLRDVAPGASCGTATCAGFGDRTVTFTTVPGSVYTIVVDGYRGASGPFSLQLLCGDCGDGNVDPSEQCDDGNTASGDGCSSACSLERCGNNVVDSGEECDDGDTTGCDGCSAACTLEGCGNFVVECAEACDDGNLVSGDGCSATCTVEGGTVTPAYSLVCGESDAYATTLSGSSDAVDHYSCVSWDETGREYAYAFTAPASGTVTVTLTPQAGVDLDVFVLSGTSSATCIAYGNAAATFMATGGTTYTIVVDGFQGAQGNYTLDVSCGGGVCGNGVVNAGEECDDGDTTSGDGCSAMCRIERCGDGVVQAGLGETCDDGNTTSGDGCSSTCRSEAGQCVPDAIHFCGATDSWSNGGAGATDRIDSYACGGGASNETGPEYAYELVPTMSGSVTVTLTPGAGDLDLFVLRDAGGGACNPTVASACMGSSTGTGTETVTFTATAGQRYYLIVDGYAGATSSYTLAVSCGGGASACGDGVLDGGEECDDGDTSSGDGCSSTCLLEGGTCQAAYTLACGASDSYSTSSFGSTDRVDRYSCQTWSETGREYTYRFTTAVDRNVTITLTPTTGQDLDLFVLLDGGDGCVAGNCVASGDNSATFRAFAGLTYYVVVDGYDGTTGSYAIDVACAP